MTSHSRSPEKENYRTQQDGTLPLLSARNRTNASGFPMPGGNDRMAMSATRFNATNRSPSMPHGANSTISSNLPAFRITKTSIPDKGSLKSAYITSARLDDLMRKPNHKRNSEKFNRELHAKQ